MAETAVAKKTLKTLLGGTAVVVLLAVILFIVANLTVFVKGRGSSAEASSMKTKPAAVVFGALVYDDGTLSSMLADRVDTAIDLYREGKVKKLLLTGDHGRIETRPKTPSAALSSASARLRNRTYAPSPRRSSALHLRLWAAFSNFDRPKGFSAGSIGYDEVNVMKKRALLKGVAVSDIFTDHAGFSTYDSVYRARDVFKIKKAILVTQRFHLRRALYIARSLQLDVEGIEADRQVYMVSNAKSTFREYFANLKAFWQVNTGARPTFLGPAIPITGDGRASRG